MAKLPEWRREGWRPNGPGHCICRDCGTTVPTNALARASHARACYRRRQDAKAKTNVGTTPSTEKAN